MAYPAYFNNRSRRLNSSGQDPLVLLTNNGANRLICYPTVTLPGREMYKCPTCSHSFHSSMLLFHLNIQHNVQVSTTPGIMTAL